MKILIPGKAKRKSEGFIFIDVLITIFILGTAFITIIGGINLVSYRIAENKQRILNFIEEKNSFAQEILQIY